MPNHRQDPPMAGQPHSVERGVNFFRIFNSGIELEENRFGRRGRDTQCGVLG